MRFFSKQPDAHLPARTTLFSLVSLTAPGLVAGLASSPAIGADATVRFELPRLAVAEYHRPYVAVWVARADQSVAGNIAVWYDVGKRNAEGTKWLKDMRQWWRRTGRDLQMPVDGVSGATRTAGEQQLALSDATGVFAKLPAGDYQLMVETAREAGGHEVVSVPFQWPPKTAQTVKGQGSHELGAVALELKP